MRHSDAGSRRSYEREVRSAPRMAGFLASIDGVILCGPVLVTLVSQVLVQEPRHWASVSCTTPIATSRSAVYVRSFHNGVLANGKCNRCI